MNAMVIFNGLSFPHHVADYALSKCKEKGMSLYALFLAGREIEEGYIFPSDLDAAQNITDKEDAEKDDFRVIRSQMRLVEDMAKGEGVICRTELLRDPSLEDVIQKARDAQLVFVDPNFRDTGLMTANFKMQELVDNLPSNIVKVVNK